MPKRRHNGHTSNELLLLNETEVRALVDELKYYTIHPDSIIAKAVVQKMMKYVADRDIKTT